MNELPELAKLTKMVKIVFLVQFKPPDSAIINPFHTLGFLIILY